MTREQLTVQAAIMLVGSGLAILAQIALAWRARKAQIATLGESKASPARIFADSEIVQSWLRLGLSGTSASLSIIIGLALYYGTFRLDGVGGVILALILYAFMAYPLAMGIFGLIYLRRLDVAMERRT